MQKAQSIFKFNFYVIKRIQQGIARRDVMRLREDRKPWHLLYHRACEWIKIGQLFNLIIKQLNSNSVSFGLCRIDIDNIASHSIGRALQLHVVSCVLKLCKTLKQRSLLNFISSV